MSDPSSRIPDPPSLARYRKQILFAGIGEQGQEQLARGRATVIGCGALGSVIADGLVRSGVGFVRIVDRDFVELTNLQRQVLYDEQDVADQLPKAIAAHRKLKRINSEIEIEPVVADVTHQNILELIEGADVIVDGTDNFEVRYLINDASLETGIPWINGGCVGSHGQVMTIFPGQTACLCCLMPDIPEPGAGETCDTAGVLGPAVHVVASLQVSDALKILSGRRDRVRPVLTILDVWDGSWRQLQMQSLYERSNCPACKGGERRWLSGESGARSTVLCGRNAVQITPSERVQLSLEDVECRLSQSGDIRRNPFLLKFQPSGEEVEITLFPDGRAIVQGTEDLTAARAVYSRYVGQ